MSTANLDDSLGELKSFADEVFDLVLRRGQQVFCGDTRSRIHFTTVLQQDARYVEAMMSGMHRHPEHEKAMAEAWVDLSRFSVNADRTFADGCKKIAAFWSSPEQCNDEGFLCLSHLTQMLHQCSEKQRGMN